MRILACGAHADDVEIGCGGTVALSVKQGHEVLILDLSAGELSSNGSPEQRLREAAAAADLLGVAERFNAGLPDGRINSRDPEQRRTVLEWLRRLRPDMILLTPAGSRHPDHAQASHLLTESAYLAGLRRYPAAGEAFRPGQILEYMDLCPADPNFVVPMAGEAEIKRRALLCYESQFTRTEGSSPTRINRNDFLEQIMGRDRYFGGLAGVACAEPFLSKELPALSDLGALRGDFMGGESFKGGENILGGKK